MSVALVCVVSGETYERYANDLYVSAEEYFRPQEDTAFLILEGREGWPAATMYRYHVLLENREILEQFEYVFLCDADMRFEGYVRDEILGEMVATEHPGYVGRDPRDLPYERRLQSLAYVDPHDGERYYAGGFVGGEVDSVIRLAYGIKCGVDSDDAKGITAVWHDESHLNMELANEPPTLVLPPSMCYPDDDSGYDLSGYERKLVALDKTPAERGAR